MKGFQEGDYVSCRGEFGIPYKYIGINLGAKCHKFYLTGPTLDEAYKMNDDIDTCAVDYKCLNQAKSALSRWRSSRKIDTLSPRGLFELHVAHAAKLRLELEAKQSNNCAIVKPTEPDTVNYGGVELSKKDVITVNIPDDFDVVGFNEFDFNGHVVLTGCDDSPIEKQWNGEGLPPVGAVCEAKHKQSDESWARHGFNVVTIKAIGDELFILESGGTTNGSKESVGIIEDYEFRPLKTEAERERDKAVADISADLFGLLNMGDSAATAVAEGLYDMGYRKQGGE